MQPVSLEPPSAALSTPEVQLLQPLIFHFWIANEGVISFSSRPALVTKKFRGHESAARRNCACAPINLAMRIELLPFAKATSCNTAYFGRNEKAGCAPGRAVDTLLQLRDRLKREVAEHFI